MPQNVPQPHENEPISVDTLPKMLLYVLMPIVVIIFYFVWRNRQKKKNTPDKESE